MRTMNAGVENNVRQTSAYAWVAAATLIVALILGAFAGTPIAGAADDGIQSGIDAGAARYQALGEYYLAKADADSARWAAIGEYYLAAADAGRERALNADSARWAALGSSFAQGTEYTDVAKFYAERMRAAAGQASALADGHELFAANPELMFAQRSYNPAASVLAANPELIFARNSYRAAASELAANPELIFARASYTSYDQGFTACSTDDNRLAANPELGWFKQASTC